jgi:hypothetical protein
MLDLLRFSELLISGRRINISGFWGIEKGIILKRFFSMPYSIPTNQELKDEVFAKIREKYIFWEISLRRKPQIPYVELPSPILKKGKVAYHRERRRLIRRAEEKIKKVSFSKEKVSEVLPLLLERAKKHQRRLPKGIGKVLEIEGIDVIRVYIGDLVGVIINLSLEDRYLLWQMGWKGYNFLPTYLLHISAERGFSLGYDIVDLGITTSEGAMKIKKELGCEIEKVYIVKFP